MNRSPTSTPFFVRKVFWYGVSGAMFRIRSLATQGYTW
jgi:hypothetical protein